MRTPGCSDGWEQISGDLQLLRSCTGRMRTFTTIILAAKYSLPSCMLDSGRTLPDRFVRYQCSTRDALQCLLIATIGSDGAIASARPYDAASLATSLSKPH